MFTDLIGIFLHYLVDILQLYVDYRPLSRVFVDYQHFVLNCAFRCAMMNPERKEVH